MTTDERSEHELHAERYHNAVYEVSVDKPAPEYSVWSWEEMPLANRELLFEASRRFLADESGPGAREATSAEQLAIALMGQARTLMTRVERDAMVFPSDLSAIADRLAQWASDARQLGVSHFADMATAEGQKADLRAQLSVEKQTAELAVTQMAQVQRKLNVIYDLFMKWGMGDLSGPKVLTRLQEVLNEQ